MRQRVDPGVVDQDVDPPGARQRRRDRRLDRRPVADVHRHREGAGDLRRHPRRAGRVDVGDGDRRPAPGEPSRDALPDRPGRAGDDGDLAGQVAAHAVTPAQSLAVTVFTWQ